LKNNGDGTFTDVTKAGGIVFTEPTPSATWADFNNDGWLDVFVGHETTVGKDNYPCELFMSNRDGTFTEVAKAAGCDFAFFVKGVTSGDYNNDDAIDLFLSTLDGKKILLQNLGTKDGKVSFKNVSERQDSVRIQPQLLRHGSGIMTMTACWMYYAQDTTSKNH
jgi:hypothetical protein